MIEPAERGGMSAALEVRRLRPVERRASMEYWVAMESRATMKPWSAAVEMVVIDERATVRDIRVVVVDHGPAPPVGAPVVPSPAESGEESDPETDSKRNPRA